MSFVYYSTFLTEGPAIILAEAVSNGFWTTPTLLIQFIQFLTDLDFSNYDARRIAQLYSARLRIPKFFQVFSFDPFRYPLVAPTYQSRFPAIGTYVYLGTSTWLAALQAVSSPLNYRDSDGPITPDRDAFYSALSVLSNLYATRESFYDRISFEFDFTLIWDVYPIVNDGSVSVSAPRLSNEASRRAKLFLVQPSTDKSTPACS